MQRESNTLLIWAVLLVAIGWRLQDFVGLGMTTNDQLVYSTDLAGRGVWEVALEYARQQGRLYVLLTSPLDLLAATYVTRSSVQAASLVVFATIPCLVAWMVSRDSDDQVLFLLAYWTLCPVGCFFTPPAAYPILWAVPLAFAGLAAALAKSYSHAPSRATLLGFGLVAFVAFFQYEPGALIAATLLLWFIHTRVPAQERQRRLYAATAMSLGLYAIAYASWRLTHGTTYEGATLGALSPGAIGRVIAAYAIGALPLTNLISGMLPVTLGDAMIGRHAWPYPGASIGSLTSSIEWMDVVVSIAGAALTGLLFAQRRGSAGEPRAPGPALANRVCLGLLILVLSNVLLALTAKYQLWARGWRPYLTSSYALFGWVVLVTAIAGQIVRRRDAALAGLTFFVVFLYSSAYNHLAAGQIRANFAKWQTVGALAACTDHLRQFQTFVVPTAFYGVFERASNWSVYWRDWTLLSFGSALHIVPDAGGAEAGSAAYIHPDRNDRGYLKAVVGRGDSRGFLIYRDELPNFLSVRTRPNSDGRGGAEIVVVEGLEKLHCRAGFRMAAFTAAGTISAVDVSWHMPDVAAGLPDDARLFVVTDGATEQAVQGLYLGFFNRSADPDGLQFWSKRVRRAGGTLRDVAEGFASSSEQSKEPLARDFRARMSQSYDRLAGRPPTAEESDRLSAFGDRPELVALLPWLIVADLLRSDDAIFANRLKVAQYYTRNVYGIIGWRAPLWEQAVRSITESPDSVQHAIAVIRR